MISESPKVIAYFFALYASKHYLQVMGKTCERVVDESGGTWFCCVQLTF